jgi:hypothetical protein
MRDLVLPLRSPNMRIMYLGRKFETRQRLREMRLQRRDHDEHERFTVTAEGELEEICELYNFVSFCVRNPIPMWSTGLIIGLTLEFRYGICPPSPLLPNAPMTSPRHESDLLIFCVSFNR